MSKGELGIFRKLIVVGLVVSSCATNPDSGMSSVEHSSVSGDVPINDVVERSPENTLLEGLKITLQNPNEVDPTMFEFNYNNPEEWISESRALNLSGGGAETVVLSELYTEEGVVAALFDVNGVKLLETPVGSSIEAFDADKRIAVTSRRVEGVEGITHAVEIIDYANQDVYQVNIPLGISFRGAALDKKTSNIIFSFGQQELSDNFHYNLLKARNGLSDSEMRLPPALYNENVIVEYPIRQSELVARSLWPQGEVLSVENGIVVIKYPVIPDVDSNTPAAILNQVMYGMAPYPGENIVYLSLTADNTDPLLRIPSDFRPEDVGTMGSGMIFEPGTSVVGVDYTIGLGSYYLGLGVPPLRTFLLTENKPGGNVYDLSNISIRTLNRSTGVQDYFEFTMPTSIFKAENSFSFTEEGNLLIIADNNKIYLVSPETLAALSLGASPEMLEQPAILDVGAAFYSHSNIPGSGDIQRY